MALSFVKSTSSFQLVKNHALPLLNASIFCQVRYKHARQWPKKEKKNPFVSRRTDFIKHLCIALVKHERVFTTREKARQLQQYGDLVWCLTWWYILRKFSCILWTNSSACVNAWFKLVTINRPYYWCHGNNNDSAPIMHVGRTFPFTTAKSNGELNLCTPETLPINDKI